MNVSSGFGLKCIVVFSVCGIELRCTCKNVILKDVFFLLAVPKRVTCRECMAGRL